MEAAIIAATIVATRTLSTSAYLSANVAYSMVFAAAGGYLTATLARERGVLHGSLLAVMIVGLALLLGPEAGRNQPRWYPAVLTFGSAAAAVFGGYLCSRFRRHYSSGHYRAG
jgi:hypothetical protein